MKLLTKAIREKLPPLYSTEGQGSDAIVQVKFFTPDSNWTWYATEASARAWDFERGEEKSVPLKDVYGFEHNFKCWLDRCGEVNVEDVTFFGFVVGHFPELGYFSLSELQSVRGPWGLPIERDLHFKPRPLKDIPEWQASQGGVS